MRWLVALVFLPFFVLAQNEPETDWSLADSLAEHVNGYEGQYKRFLALERALYFLSLEEREHFVRFEKGLNKNQMKARELLIIDAYPVREQLTKGEYEDAAFYPVENNPYRCFHKGNALFNIGETDSARVTYLKGLPHFLANEDSIYYTNVASNLGAVHWHQNNLDSALYYFLKAKERTSWFNGMLEYNILAISNTLRKYDLSEKQINYILKNLKERGEEPNSYFLNNAYYYYRQVDSVKLDSMRTYIVERHPSMSTVDMALVPIFINNQWYVDSLTHYLWRYPPNAEMYDIVEELVQSDLIARSEYTPELLQHLSESVGDDFMGGFLDVFSRLDSADRLKLTSNLRSIQEAQELNSIRTLEQLAREYDFKIEQNEERYQQVYLLLASLLIAALIGLLIGQHFRFQRVKQAAALMAKNAELAEKNATISQELNSVRNSIARLTDQNMKELRGLRAFIERSVQEGAADGETVGDVQIIATLEEGILRFRINRITQSINSPLFERLEQHLTQKEMQLLKLTAMDFRSKEIAQLLNVTPQHVNNTRSKIKNYLENEMGIVDFDVYLETLRMSIG